MKIAFKGGVVPVSTNLDIEAELFYDTETENGWNQIGVPNRKVYLWKDIQVVQYDPDSGTTTFGPSGVTSPGVSAYIDTRLWKWTGRPDLPYVSYDPYDSGATAQLRPYTGYWVKTKQPNVFLVFPADAGEPAPLFESFYDVPRVSQADISRTVLSESPPMPGVDSGRRSSDSGCFIGTSLHTAIPVSVSVIMLILLTLCTYCRKYRGGSCGKNQGRPN